MLYTASELAGSCGHGNEPLGSIKGGESLWLAEWLLASQEGLCFMELVMIYARKSKLLTAWGRSDASDSNLRGKGSNSVIGLVAVTCIFIVFLSRLLPG
jgi:hypothetical protein